MSNISLETVRIPHEIEANSIHSNSNQAISPTGLSDAFPTDTLSPLTEENAIEQINRKTCDELSLANAAENLSAETHISPVSAIPSLEKPGIQLPNTLEAVALLSQNKKLNQKERFGMRELDEILSQLSHKTIDEILHILTSESAELQKKNIITTNETLEIYQELKKANDELTQKVKDAILRDENLAARLKTPAKIASAASLICGLAVAAKHFTSSIDLSPILSGVCGLLFPNGEIVGDALGKILKVSISALAAAAPVLTTASVGLKSFEAYSKLNLESQTFQHIIAEAERTYYERHIDTSFDRLAQTTEVDSFFKKFLGRHIKQSHLLANLMLQK